MHTLYHYIHCPFCLRVRMAYGFFKIPYKSIVLDYSEEKIPIDLCGKKMLPIASFPDGKLLNESLDIIKEIRIQHVYLMEFQLRNLEILIKPWMIYPNFFTH